MNKNAIYLFSACLFLTLVNFPIESEAQTSAGLQSNFEIINMQFNKPRKRMCITFKDHHFLEDGKIPNFEYPRKDPVHSESCFNVETVLDALAIQQGGSRSHSTQAESMITFNSTVLARRTAVDWGETLGFHTVCVNGATDNRQRLIVLPFVNGDALSTINLVPNPTSETSDQTELCANVLATRVVTDPLLRGSTTERGKLDVKISSYVFSESAR